jgi:hypothetical protein
MPIQDIVFIKVKNFCFGIFHIPQYFCGMTIFEDAEAHRTKPKITTHH